HARPPARGGDEDRKAEQGCEHADLRGGAGVVVGHAVLARDQAARLAERAGEGEQHTWFMRVRAVGRRSPSGWFMLQAATSGVSSIPHAATPGLIARWLIARWLIGGRSRGAGCDRPADAADGEADAEQLAGAERLAEEREAE